MATWSGLMTYIRKNYKISDEGEGYCHLVFKMRNGRLQNVLLFQHKIDGMGDWVDIQSPVGAAADLPLLAVLQEVGGLRGRGIDCR